jgi:hypothetical protein
MAKESSDPITAAMIATENEIAGFAWGVEDTDPADPTGDRSLEGMGDGLEGQHEPDEGEEPEGDEPEDGEGDEPVVEPKPEVVEPKPGEQQPIARADTQGLVPSRKLREAGERARALEVERDALKAAMDKRDADTKAQLDLMMRELAVLKTAPRDPVKPMEATKPEVIPDIFEDPTGFAKHLQKGFQDELARRDAQLSNLRVENSMAIAHKFHKDAFEKAWSAVNALNPQDPDARQTVQRIMASPDPGEALVNWHKRNETLAIVGDDPTKFVEKTRAELRESLLKDPEFRKQLLAEMRGEATNGADGQARNVTRLPRSLAAVGGSNGGVDRIDPNAFDGSPQAIAESAWK